MNIARAIRITKRKLQYKLKGPIWTRHPETIQLDTHNFCNLDCTFCNVQHSFNLSKGTMPSKTIEYVLKYFGKRDFFAIAPFLNGEPMLEKRLPQIIDMAKNYCNTQCIIDTNGTVYKNRHLLVHSNLWKVRFTISAAVPETYELVHGKPLFREACRTLYWFLAKKHPNQVAWLHFIATKDNIHEVDRWIKRFRGVGRTIFPVHRGKHKINSEQVQTGELTKPFVVTADNQRLALRPTSEAETNPCPCWGIMAIGWDGEIMQCTDFPYKYNYGKVGEVDLLEAWQERLKNKMDNPCCRSCSIRFPNWKKVLGKWVTDTRHMSGHV